MDKLQLLRTEMQLANVQACIIPTTDAHINEYTPEHWKTREWISGFTGSAGTVVVTMDKAGLWTDSRYFLQAEEQLSGTDIQLFKVGLSETPTFTAWLQQELPPQSTLAFDGMVFSAAEALALIQAFEKTAIDVKTNFNPFDKIWEKRPKIPMKSTFILPEHYAGESAASKIERLRDEMRKKETDFTLLSSLDMIAWLFNLRGNDIAYNPVAIAYAAVSMQEAVLFIHSKKLTPEVTEYLKHEGVTVAKYEKCATVLANKGRVLVTPNKINYHYYELLRQHNTLVETEVHPIDQLKAIKNETEIEGFRNAMKRDSVALVKFFAWLDKQLSVGKAVTELDVRVVLRHFRSEQEHFFSESFATIAGYGAHGAIVHYAATPETNARILPEGLLLIDSGAQYLDGTTDITRTIAVGKVSDEMKRDFTLILKGHIALAQAKFPKGTVGMQLDVLARQFIWQEGQNYLHGTGHGVGHFLNVHEGPQSIRMNYNPAPLLPGMVTSNEPGLYKTGKYGIRTENLLLTIPVQNPDEMGDFYAFETLTLCPIDTQLIAWSLMSENERKWLSDYHQRVLNAVKNSLSIEEKEWLNRKIAIR